MHRKCGELDDAEVAYDKMTVATLRMIELEPAHPRHLDARSCDFERLGDLQMQRKNYDKALEYYLEQVRYSELYIADDPTNLFRYQAATWSYQRIGNAYKALGQTERVGWAEGRLKEIRAKVAGN